jgi:hypothetical protein
MNKQRKKKVKMNDNGTYKQTDKNLLAICFLANKHNKNLERERERERERDLHV